MSKRLTRHEMLKQDDFVTGVAATAGWVERHFKTIGYVMAATAAVAVLAAGLAWYLSRRGEDARRLLGEALATLDATVGSAAETQAPGRRYGSAQERDEKALASLDLLLSRHPFSRAATIGAYMRGTTLLSLGRTQEAREALERFTRDYAASDLVPLARRALAGLEMQSGNPAKAAELYRSLSEAPGVLVPADAALFDWARALEASEQSSEASRVYQRLLAEHPQSSYSSDAGQAVARLTAAGSAAGSAPRL